MIQEPNPNWTKKDIQKLELGESNIFLLLFSIAITILKRVFSKKKKKIKL